MCQTQTIQYVTRHLGVSWDVIKDIQKKDLKRRFGKPKLKWLRRIAIDEIAVAKEHLDDTRNEQDRLHEALALNQQSS